MSEELKAIKEIGEQVEGFKTILGDKADSKSVEEIKSSIKALEEGLESMTEKQVDEKIKSINDELKKMHDQVEKVLEEQAEAKEKGEKSKAKTQRLTEEQIKAFVEGTFDGAVLKEGSYVGGKKTQNSARIEIKAPETFGYPTFFEGDTDTDITAFTGRYVDPVLYQRKRKRNFVFDYLDIQTINVPSLVYLVKVEIGDDNPTAGDPGGAAWILSGAPKPKRSFRVTSATAEAKKVAIFGTVEDKLLRDVASLENWIREDFMDEMRETINDGLLNNNPAVDANAPLGLKTNAVQYTATPAYDELVPTPNYIDDIIAAIAFMAYNKENADMVFVSSDVYYRMLHLKATDGKWLNNNLVYIGTDNRLYITGVPVIPVDEEDVPSTHILVIGADLGFKIKAYGSMVFERGLNGEDFREDKTSYRGYQEFLTYFPENRENSVLYDTFANIEAAITLPVAP